MKSKKRNNKHQNRYRKTSKKEKKVKSRSMTKKNNNDNQGGNRFKNKLKDFLQMTARSLPSSSYPTNFKYLPPFQSTRKNYVFKPLQVLPQTKYYGKIPTQSFLKMLETKPQPPFRVLEEIDEELDLDEIFLEDGRINIEFLSTNHFRDSLYRPPKNVNEREVERKLKENYIKLIRESISTSPYLSDVENLENKKSWIGWTAIAEAIDPRTLIVESTTKGVLDILFLGVRTLVLTTVASYKMVAPAYLQLKVSEIVPRNIQAYGIEGYILLRSIDSGAFSSIIGLTFACLTKNEYFFKNTDWSDPRSVTNFYDGIVKSVSPILPVLLEDITNEGCKTVIPAVIRQVAVEGSLAHTALSEGFKALSKENSLSTQLIESITDLGNVIVPLISQHMNKNGIHCGGDLINDEAAAINCLGRAGYLEAKKFFNKSLKLIVDSMSYCLKEHGQEFVTALISSEHPDLPKLMSEEDKEKSITDFITLIKNEDLSTRILDKITNIYLSSVANDVKDVRTVATERLENDLKTISSPYASIIKKKLKQQIEKEEESRIQALFDELEELIDPTYKILKTPSEQTTTLKSKYSEAREGTVSITKITTNFDVNELIRLLSTWAENINVKLGENKPYSVTECLLEAIDLRLPHLLSEFFGLRDEKLLEFADRASSQPIGEMESNYILKTIIDDYVKPIAISVCIEEYIKPEEYGEIKIVSLFSFFILGPSP